MRSKYRRLKQILGLTVVLMVIIGTTRFSAESGQPQPSCLDFMTTPASYVRQYQQVDLRTGPALSIRVVDTAANTPYPIVAGLTLEPLSKGQEIINTAIDSPTRDNFALVVGTYNAASPRNSKENLYFTSLIAHQSKVMYTGIIDPNAGMQWSPDGTSFAFVKYDGQGHQFIDVINADGAEIKTFPSPNNYAIVYGWDWCP